MSPTQPDGTHIPLPIRPIALAGTIPREAYGTLLKRPIRPILILDVVRYIGLEDLIKPLT